MGKFCSNCGKELNEVQSVCLNCGVATNNNIQTDKTDRNAACGFILGLISIVAWLIPLFGYPVSICGIIFSSKGLKSTINKEKAIIGLVLSIVFLVFTLGNSLAGLIMWISNYSYYY